MTNVNCLNFVTNNIKGIQNNSERLSVVEYFRNKLGNNGISIMHLDNISHLNQRWLNTNPVD